MIKFAQYKSFPEDNIYDVNGCKTTTKSLGCMKMKIAQGFTISDYISDYVNDDNIYSYVLFDYRIVVETKNNKIQKYTSYNTNKKNKISQEYVCKDGEIILAKRYNDQGDLIGSVKKVDKIN